MIRVGFVLEGEGWLGGVNYYRNLFSALSLLPEKEILPFIFVGTKVPENISQNFRDAKIIRTSLLDRKSPLGLLRRVGNKLTGQRDPLLSILMRMHGIKVLSHAGAAMPGLGIKTLGWIPDFQHLHLPAFHSSKECKQRDTLFKKLTSHCDAIVVSSQAAFDDLKKFSPEAVDKVAVLHFVPDIDTSKIAGLSISELEEKYGFRRPYFYVPNQFWKHKNHKTVVAAMAKLNLDGGCPNVVFSGNTHDYRNPSHFDDLLMEVERLGVRDFFKVLGVIPYEDLLSLMRNSIALINPSLFEGWSSTVEEAKALDKEIILSSIPVHLEQNPSRARYFSPLDADTLARHMQCMLHEKVENHANTYFYAEDYKERRLAFAEQYRSIVFSLIGSANSDFQR